MPELTAMTASAASTAVRSTHDEMRYPPPSCSAFHGRIGSSEWAVSTCGMPYSSAARCPASPVYQVCECTTVAVVGGVGHHQIGRKCGQRRVGALERRVGLVDECPVARSAHAVHVDLAQIAQLRDEFGDVDACAAVHLGRIFTRHHRHPHAYDRSVRRRAPQPCEERRLWVFANYFDRQSRRSQKCECLVMTRTGG